MTQTGVAKGPSDQKTLNEELIEGLVEVARRNPQHAVELFGVPLGVAMRLAAMPDAQLDDLATTPVALWRPALTERLVRRLPERRPMLTPDHEVYRPLVKRINRLALATFVRYADDPASAALVCDITDREVIRALQELPAFAFLEWGGNPGTLLAVPRLSDALIDRLLRAGRRRRRARPARPAGPHAMLRAGVRADPPRRAAGERGLSPRPSARGGQQALGPAAVHAS